MVASTTTTAEFSAAIDRMRQRIGNGAEHARQCRNGPARRVLAGLSAVWSCQGISKPDHSTLPR